VHAVDNAERQGVGWRMNDDAIVTKCCVNSAVIVEADETYRRRVAVVDAFCSGNNRWTIRRWVRLNADDRPESSIKVFAELHG
jgi:hypothetical protein